MKKMKEVIFGNQEVLKAMPDLIEIQTQSYEWFLQKDVPASKRKKQGLQALFKTYFPIEDANGDVILDFVEYTIDNPKYDEDECRYLGKTYGGILRAKFRLIYKKTGEVREQEVFMDEIPFMTPRGTFIINGAERVVVNQIYRSPGILFSIEEPEGIYLAKIVPEKGSWLEFEIDQKGILIVRIDRKRKISLSTFLKAIGVASLPVFKIKSIEKDKGIITIISDKKIAERIPVCVKFIFTKSETPIKEDDLSETFFVIDKKIKEEDENEVYIELSIGKTPYKEIKNLDEYDLSGKKYIKFHYDKSFKVSEQKNILRPVPLYNLNQIILSIFYNLEKIELKGISEKAKITKLLLGKFAGVDIYDITGNKVILRAGERITTDVIEQIIYENIPYVYILDISKYHDEFTLIKSITTDNSNDTLECIESIMSIIRPGDIVNPETAEESFKALFYNEDHYDLSPVGRFKLNKKFLYNPPIETTTLIEEDIIRTIDTLIKIYIQDEDPDDIDHLGNRRVRSVGELLTNQLQIGFARMDKIIRERFTLLSPEAYTPQNLISIKPFSNVLGDFFKTSQLSQFMDQTNPLAELTHKRRLNALGPGGLTRERAGFEVRDVHYTHYGRICPIETPEGPNIGLIVSLATFAKINEYGFIVTPYRKVEDGRVTDKIEYLTAVEEEHYKIAQANAKLDEQGRFTEKLVSARYKNEFLFVNPKEVQYMDLTPSQLFSVSTSLIPFLEHDDANRALMGSNMQRQAVPLLTTEQPFIKTGMEKYAAYYSGAVNPAKRAGEVIDVSADKIVIKPLNPEKKDDIDIYYLQKFRRTNQSTCYNQKPIVKIGDKVKAGDIIADGPATCNGELSLGKNVLVAFMPFEGYNFEDAILISEKLLKEDKFTSIHIEEFECLARDTKLGKEVITRDIPNLSEDALKELDENGIIRIGAEVKPGDILVGKVTPKGESDLTPEYKLLHSIFGEKAREVRDTSLRVPHGIEGTVIDVKVYSREDGYELEPGVEKYIKVYVATKRKLSVGDKFAGRHGNKGVLAKILPEEDMPFLPDGTPVDMVLNPLGVPSRMNIGQIFETELGFAAKILNVQFITPVFQGPKSDEIEKILKEANIEPFAKYTLYDGRTGEPFKNKITVGYMYMMKLSHLVDDKIHARSTGPYSLVTQQPLGGKAQFGGQRFGEMEVWALEAYGSAHTLQELLTVKSDDMRGRSLVYESIIKGKNPSAPGIPEAFNVLAQEIRGLALDITVYNSKGQQISLFERAKTDWTKLRKRTFDDLLSK